MRWLRQRLPHLLLQGEAGEDAARCSVWLWLRATEKHHVSFPLPWPSVAASSERKSRCQFSHEVDHAGQVVYSWGVHPVSDHAVNHAS